MVVVGSAVMVVCFACFPDVDRLSDDVRWCVVGEFTYLDTSCLKVVWPRCCVIGMLGAGTGGSV